MKEIGEAIVAVVLLGIALSTIIAGVVVSGGNFPAQGFETCEYGTAGDCTLYLFVFVWVLAAIVVSSIYLALRFRRGTRCRQGRESLQDSS
jgi:hypothetical protein